MKKLFSSVKISGNFSCKAFAPPALLAGRVTHLEMPTPTPPALGCLPPMQSCKSRLPEKPHLHVLRKSCKVSTAKLSWEPVLAGRTPAPGCFPARPDTDVGDLSGSTSTRPEETRHPRNSQAPLVWSEAPKMGTGSLFAMSFQ